MQCSCGKYLGADPDTARRNFIIFALTGHATHELHTSAIGSFRVIATVERADSCGATINVWMYNEMSRRSFGRFANHPLFRWRPMRSQFMWWNWKEEIAIRGSQAFDVPAALGEYIVSSDDESW